MIQPILGLISACYLWECYLWVCDPFGRCAGDEVISESLFVWVSHQQMAPNSNSSSLRAIAVFPILPRLVAS